MLEWLPREEVTLLLVAAGALGCLVLGVLELLWPTGVRRVARPRTAPVGRRSPGVAPPRSATPVRRMSSDRLVDICAESGMAFIPWYPLAAGRVASPNSPVARIAQRHGATPSQISLAWLLQRSPAMLPIPGTSSIAHLEENLASASVRLTSDEFRTLASL